MTSRFLRGLVALCFMLTLGCKDVAGAGGTGGVALYAFDSTTSSVMVWSDINTLYDSATTPAYTYKFNHDLLNKVSNLAWGGMCLDATRGILYLVSADTGVIVRMSSIRSQSGTVPESDIASFQLDTSARLNNGSFGQIAVDAQSDTLLITESGDNGTRIWAVAHASLPQPASVPLGTPLQVSGDMGGKGVAAYGGSVYAYMDDGDPVGDYNPVSGPRLRKGTTSGFDSISVLSGDKTGLHKYGSLALDTANGYLFVGVHDTDAPALTTNPILVFQTGQFGSGGNNQAPTQPSLGSPTEQATLRVLSHAGTKDWLVGLRGQGDTAYPTLLLWKSPMGGTAAVVKTVDPSGTAFKGVALDGNAS